MDIHETVDLIDKQLGAEGCPDGARMKACAAIMSELLAADRAARLSRDNLQRELELHGYNYREAARAVGCHHSTLYRKLVA